MSDDFRTAVEDAALTNWLQAGAIRPDEIEVSRVLLSKLDAKDLSTVLLESWIELANAVYPNHLLVVLANPICPN